MTCKIVIYYMREKCEFTYKCQPGAATFGARRAGRAASRGTLRASRLRNRGPRRRNNLGAPLAVEGTPRGS